MHVVNNNNARESIPEGDQMGKASRATQSGGKGEGGRRKKGDLWEYEENGGYK
jgi:hypothetical protein